MPCSRTDMSAPLVIYQEPKSKSAVSSTGRREQCGPGYALKLGDDGSTYLARVDLLTTEGVVVGTHDGSLWCVTWLMRFKSSMLKRTTISRLREDVGHVIIGLRRSELNRQLNFLRNTGRVDWQNSCVDNGS